MDPVTGVAIAQFAFSAYGMFSKRSSGDPIDALVAMLVEINKKLNIINEKIDVIYSEVVKLPDKIEYKRRLNDIISVSNRIPLLYKNLQDDIKKDRAKGKNEFIKKNEADIKSYLNVLRLSVAVLKSEYDTLTISLISNACQIDYELCKLINLDNEYVKNEQEEYLRYIKQAIWLNDNNVEDIIEKAKNNIRAVSEERFIHHYLHFDVSQGYPRQVFTLTMYYPEFETLSPNTQDQKLITHLNTVGYFDSLMINRSLTDYVTQSIDQIPANNTYKVIKTSTYFDGGRFTTNKNDIVKYKNDRLNTNKSTYSNNQTLLMATCSCHYLALETVKHINTRIQ